MNLELDKFYSKTALNFTARLLLRGVFIIRELRSGIV